MNRKFKIISIRTPIVLGLLILFSCAKVQTEHSTQSLVQIENRHEYLSGFFTDKSSVNPFVMVLQDDPLVAQIPDKLFIRPRVEASGDSVNLNLTWDYEHADDHKLSAFVAAQTVYEGEDDQCEVKKGDFQKLASHFKVLNDWEMAFYTESGDMRDGAPPQKFKREGLTWGHAYCFIWKTLLVVKKSVDHSLKATMLSKIVHLDLREAPKNLTK